MELQRCAIGWSSFGLALLICGVALLVIPNERATVRRRYNDAVVRWNAHPPPPFVSGSVVGSVSSDGKTSNLTVISTARSWSGLDSDGTLAKDDYYLQGWLPVAHYDNFNGDVSFTFGNTTFPKTHRTLVYESGWLGPLCVVVDVVGSRILPSAEFGTCYYPFTLGDGEQDRYGPPTDLYDPTSSSLRVVVRARNDPSIVKQQLLGRGHMKLRGNRFQDFVLIRPFVGLALAIAGMTIGAFVCGAFARRRCLRWQRARARVQCSGCGCHSIPMPAIEGQIVAVSSAIDPKDIAFGPEPVVGMPMDPASAEPQLASVSLSPCNPCP